MMSGQSRRELYGNMGLIERIYLRPEISTPYNVIFTSQVRHRLLQEALERSSEASQDILGLSAS